MITCNCDDFRQLAAGLWQGALLQFWLTVTTNLVERRRRALSMAR